MWFSGGEKSGVMFQLTSLIIRMCHSPADIERVLEGKWGKTCNKDFLRTGAQTPLMKRGNNDRKQQCFIFYTMFSPFEMVEEL